ncbi:MAG: ATP-dependent DNA helicase RecG, partial [Nitrospinae bacterium CG11_big_fil_rev_8_21_14_0_20_56_8]
MNFLKNRLLQDSLQYIKGVGPKRAALFEKLELRTTEDCLFFLPFRFEDRTRVKKISQLIHNEQVTVEGTILNAGSFRIGRRKKIFEVIVQDETGTLRAKWFQFNEKYMLEKFPIGKSLVISGKPVSNRRLGIGFEMIHPECEILTGDAPDALEIGKIIPVYHTTEGLHLKSLRTILKTVVDHYADLAEEFLPEEIMRRHRFPPRQECLRQAHFPAQETDTRLLNQFKTPAQQRLIFEELFLIQLALGFKKKHASRAANGTPLKTRGATIRNFFGHLPFELTGAQKRVLGEIMNDLEQDRPMNRLLQGDVGSGKTVVALICLLTAVDNGYQAALMAPTELLSEQHYLNLKPYCDKLGIPIELVTSTATGRERKRIQEEIRSGKIHIIIGTHALIQKDVSFDNLALAVIDEQHRFGVLQREAIGKKGGNPHLLIMTATPIPRSLALTLYGDLDVSYLDEFPPGRQPIPTRVVQSRDRETAYRQIRKEILQGRQAYVVCPLIEESENSDLKAAVEVQEQLKREWFPDLQIALIHGRMKKEERQKIMADFLAGAIHILVATTVIEVGIDVPNATLMIVEHAERFGLSQLHQLRGRVGRGQHASHCFLLAYPPLSDEGRLRLQAMEESNDGFRIAEEDLKIRGPGDFMGTRQSGMPLLRVANLLRDLKILDLARKEAFALI